jgi:ligand-binding sensor domain-containing protein/serine phosphatase RsbU (regulator of sigma subunit)
MVYFFIFAYPQPLIRIPTYIFMFFIRAKLSAEKKALIFIFFLASFGSVAQQFNFISYGIEDGLPHSTVFEIYQDHDGYLWIGTDGGGLCRYDGLKFRSYGKSNGLKGSVIRKITEDDRNRMWVATNSGLYYFENGIFYSPGQIANNSSVFFTTVFKDRAGTIWAGTAGRGIFRISIRDNKFQVQNYNSSGGLSGDHVFDICEDGKGKIWIASFGNGFDVFDPSSGTFTGVKLRQPLANEIISLKKTDATHLAFGTKSAGAFLINTEVKGEPEFNLIPGTAGLQVWSIAVDEENNCWIATDKAGLVCTNALFLNTTNGLPVNKIYKVFIDREKNTWVGSVDAGMLRFLGHRFTHITSGELAGLDAVSSVSKDKDGSFWLGSPSGLYHCGYAGNAVKPISRLTTRDGLCANEITGMSRGADNTLWISTWNGVSAFNGKSFKNYSRLNGLESPNASCILADSRNRIWIGTNAGLSLLNEERKFSSISESNGLVNNEVQCLFEDRFGNIWIGTYGGLVKYDGENLRTFDDDEGLTEKQIQSIAEDKNGRIYIGTFGGGIFRYTPASSVPEKIEFLCGDEVLSSGNVNSLTFINDSTLMVASHKGLNKITFDGNFHIKAVRAFGIREGFKNIENSQNAAFNNGTDVWFGTNKGVTIYHIGSDRTNQVKPAIKLTGIKVNGVSRAPEEKLRLKYDENSLKISFVSVSLTEPEAGTFYTRLLGQDTTWSKLLSDRQSLSDTFFVEHKKLLPGNYELLIKAKNSNGLESETASVKFFIARPFYKTAWFLICSLGFFVLLVYLFFKVREKKILNEKEKLERVVTVRTAEVVASKKEIEQQKNLLEIQKHEITDSINYSRKIQNAILPQQSDLFKKIEQSFILYQPKDIVSGDFYFFHEKGKNAFYLAVADCTGHGVPGAFMSMLGSRELTGAVNMHAEPSDILSALNVGMRKTLRQNHDEIGIKDGMDIGVLRIDTSSKSGKMKVSYSGANRPLWILRKNETEVSEIRATKTAIGGYTQDDQVFAQHEIVLEKGDAAYLFSDGYADQFGSETGKKMMTKRFKQLLKENRNLSMPEQGLFLENYFKEWMGSTNEQVDDVLIIGLRA